MLRLLGLGKRVFEALIGILSTDLGVEGAEGCQIRVRCNGGMLRGVEGNGGALSRV